MLSIKRYAIDIAYGKNVVESDILFLTETQARQTDHLNAMQSFLESIL